MRIFNHFGRGLLCLYAGAAIGLALVLTVAYVRFADSGSETGSGWVRARIEQSLNALATLPRTSRAKPRILFVGASDVEVGVDPIAVDQATAALGLVTESFNLGYRNLDPKLIRLLAERICEIERGRGETLDLVALKFTPLRTTKAFALSSGRFAFYRNFLSVESAIFSGPMLGRHFLGHFPEVLDVSVTKFLFFGVSPNSTAENTFSLLLGAHSQNRFPNPNVNLMLQMNSRLWQHGTLLSVPAWDAAARGDFFFGYPKTYSEFEEITAAYRNAEVRKIYLTGYQRKADIFELRFDPEFIMAQAEALARFKDCARHVVLLYFPDSPEIPRSEVGYSRLQSQLSELSEKGGVPLVDVSARGKFLGADYFDYLHLNRAGRLKLAQALAPELVRLLAREGSLEDGP